MSTLLAPFHHGMRLGQGFNSFSQELKINDVVQKPGGIPATDTDLNRVSAYKPRATDPRNAATPLSTPEGTVSRIDPHTQVSQTIKWEARFIQHLSDITRRMDVSGAHIIRSDSLGSTSKAQGYIVDEVVFKEADLNYMIHVEVLNQRLVGDSVTQFIPLRNVSPIRFTEVYGDSFISGFLEGGTFNALVSIKLNKEVASGVVERALADAFIGLPGLGSFDKVHGAGSTVGILTAHESSISVAWSGGGEIMPQDSNQWDIENLRKTAMEFPDAVALCPERTSAIITKYTALRSFHELPQRGFPLSYENAGFQAHDLLDSYSDYKVILAALRGLIIDINKNGHDLVEQRQRPDLIDFADKIRKSIAQRKIAIAAKRQLLSVAAFTNLTSPSAGVDEADSPMIMEDMLPPNPLTPYKASVVGLEEALHDARFEMTKIAKEVDKLIMYPQILSDISRPPQFLSPSVFKLLIPVPNSHAVNTPDSQEVIDSLSKAKDAALAALDTARLQNKALEEREKSASSQLETANAKLSDTNKTLEDQKKQITTLENSLSTSTSRITELSTNTKAIQAGLDEEKNKVSDLTKISSMSKDYISARLRNACHKETLVTVRALRAEKGGVDVQQKFNTMLGEIWSGSRSEIKFGELGPDPYDPNQPGNADKSFSFIRDLEFRRGNYDTGFVDHTNFIGMSKNTTITEDFYRILLNAPSSDHESMTSFVSKVGKYRLKGANFRFTDSVGAPLEKPLTMWDTNWPEIDEYDVVKEIIFYKSTSNVGARNPGFVGISLTTEGLEKPVVVGTPTSIMERVVLEEDDRIVGAELRGGLISGYGKGDVPGPTAAWFWTHTGKKLGFDLEPQQKNRPMQSGPAPIPGYVLKGFWGGKGEILDRIGIIWGIDAPRKELEEQYRTFCWNYSALSGPWKKFVQDYSRPDWRMSDVAGLPTTGEISHPIGSVASNLLLKNIVVYQGSEDFYGFKLVYQDKNGEEKPVMLGTTKEASTVLTSDFLHSVVSVAIWCGESPSMKAKIPLRVRLISPISKMEDAQGYNSEWIGLNVSAVGPVLSVKPGEGWLFKGFAMQRDTQMVRSMAVLWGRDDAALG